LENILARGILAEINRALKASARESERQQRESARAYQAALREDERARKEELRFQAQLIRADEKERKRLEKEAKVRHVEKMTVKAAAMTQELEEVYSDIDGLLAATLDVDDYVDLELLRRDVVHPPFVPCGLENPVPLPRLPAVPNEPPLELPAPLSGLGKLIGKKKHEAAVREAKRAHSRKLNAWATHLATIEKEREQLLADHSEKEAQRKSSLAEAKASYEEECQKREANICEQNNVLDRLIADLGYGVDSAVKDYVEIVLFNSVYPETFAVEYDGRFDSSTAELNLFVKVPSPEHIPNVKQYRYVRSSDEIVPATLSQKAQKDRYSGAIHQVALRTLHEIFEADRRALIQTISLVLGTKAVNPATGKTEEIPFVGVSAGREEFIEIDLANVVPLATLQHLNASLSKNPFGLVPAILAGIR
jgi:restriction system protein